MKAPVVVFAVGNPGRGDDAIGPTLCGQLADWQENEGLADVFELVEDFQLNIEHALDLDGRELALFIDAGTGTEAPFGFQKIHAETGIAHSTHALPPPAVLQVYRQTEGHAPPPAFVLCVRGEEFDLGAPLTAAAAAHLALALDFLKPLLRHPELAAWEAALSA